MARELRLTRGKVALVDDSDFPALEGYRWHAKPADQMTENWYACRHGRDGEPRTVYLHRLLMAAKPGQCVDHINHDGLDNRRQNLRLCTRRENCINRIYPVSASGFRGVAPYKGKWRTGVTHEVEVIRVGALSTPELAARVYDALAREFQGEFAILNFPVRERAA